MNRCVPQLSFSSEAAVPCTGPADGCVCLHVLQAKVMYTQQMLSVG